MMGLLSPWRDANEFWLLLGAGLFVAAFPLAWGAVLGQLYGPLCVMLIGNVLRTVAFEFRLRARTEIKPRWVFAFWAGSVLSAFGQGLTLGRIATGYQTVAGYGWFAVFVGMCAVATYILLGATWLVMRVRGELQRRAANWARHAVRWAAAGMVAIAVTLGLANAGIFYKWSNLSHIALAATLWAGMLALFVATEMMLARLPGKTSERWVFAPFLCSIGLIVLMQGGLAFSLFPYLILDDMTLWDGAASTPSLKLAIMGASVGIPVALVFNLFAYRSVFGQARGPAAP